MVLPPLRFSSSLPVGLAALAALAAGLGLARQEPQAPHEIAVDPAMHHLGNDPTPEWKEAPAEPEGFVLQAEFEAPAWEGEALLFLDQRDVHEEWAVSLNGRELFTLKRELPLGTRWYVLPPGSLREGRNLLAVAPRRPGDDITVGRIRILLQSLEEHFRLGTLAVTVRDRATGAASPARITVVDQEGRRVPLFRPDPEATPVRDGVFYPPFGRARVRLAAGRYRVYATRGPEWSLARAEVEVPYRGQASLDLELAREVDTRGWIACDTHIHTVTFSGHGDASLDERLWTLAGEGVEVPIATDHNHQTDYRSRQVELGLTDWYTPVTGNEVSTENGHFNAFPLNPGGPLPDHRLTDWEALVADIRAKGARVVILNHPRWPSFDEGPFGVFTLNRASGDRQSGAAFTFDALEIYNSTEAGSPPEMLLRDWFALLNRGDRVGVVGSSDSHTVLDPVGQGRTWVPVSDDDPARVDLEEVYAAFQEGRTVAGLGVFAVLEAGGEPAMGRLLDGRSGRLQVSLRVASASWLRPEKVTLYLNGLPVEVRELPPGEGPLDTVLDFDLMLPPHDAFLVAAVRGPSPGGVWWFNRLDWSGAITNPAWIDREGDGTWTSARDLARDLLQRIGGRPEALLRSFEEVDAAVAIQALALSSEAAMQALAPELERRAAAAGPAAELLRLFLEDRAAVSSSH